MEPEPIVKTCQAPSTKSLAVRRSGPAEEQTPHEALHSSPKLGLLGNKGFPRHQTLGESKANWYELDPYFLILLLCSLLLSSRSTGQPDCFAELVKLYMNHQFMPNSLSCKAFPTFPCNSNNCHSSNVYHQALWKFITSTNVFSNPKRWKLLFLSYR